ncbi:MAG: tripartite tricarboxylate transporter substrate binding protein [Deltaproteobacteria bacterium]|nr:tripartite tricarboxylate transporter substrate binding protein [Deltaproteobacteria bacterium]
MARVKSGKFLVLAMLAMLALPVMAAAEDLKYPTRNIEVACGWGAGGGTDLFARSISKPVGELLNTNMVVVNMPGASGAIAGDYVTKQDADGHTIWTVSSNYVVNVAAGKTPHGLDAYEPVIRLQHDTTVLAVNTEKSPFKTIEELVAYAKENPGKLTLGGTGSASFDEVMAVMLLNAMGIEMQYVPYESAGAMQAALLGGHLDAILDEFGPLGGYLASNSMTPLVVLADKRVEAFPNLPCTVEKGWNCTIGIWRGVLVKKGTDPQIVKKLHDTFLKASEDADYMKLVKESNLDLRPGYLNSEDFGKFLKTEVDELTVAMKQLGF